MRPALTQRQNEVFEYVRTYLKQQGRPPTLQEIGVALGVASPSGVRKHLMVLEKKGYVRRQPRAARGVRLVDADLDPLSADLGSVALPVISRSSTATESGALRFAPAAYFRVDPYFLLKAEQRDRCLLGICTDDGMSTAGIRKGDFLAIEEVHWHRLRNVETVAVRVGEELRARQFVRQRDRIKLRPADHRYVTVTFIPGQAYIIGRVVAVMRRL